MILGRWNSQIQSCLQTLISICTRTHAHMHTYAHTPLSLYTHAHTCTHLYVILENFALEVIECFVRFLYHGTLDDSPPPELLWELALMGKSYDVPNLQDQCFAWLEYYAFVLSHLQKMVRKVALDAETQRKNTLKRHGRYGENAAGVLVTTLLCSSWQHRLWACFFGDPPADSPLPFWIKYVTATSPTA